MLAQLVVILLLMAVLVGAIFFLHQYVTSHSSAPAISGTSLRVTDRLQAS